MLGLLHSSHQNPARRSLATLPDLTSTENLISSRIHLHRALWHTLIRDVSVMQG